jgi:hypothetical protein
LSTDWKPKLAPTTDLRTLTLTVVEGFLVSRLDGYTTPTQLTLLTGMPAEQVRLLLERLVSEGAVVPPEVPAPKPAPEPVPAAASTSEDPPSEPEPDPEPEPEPESEPSDSEPEPEAGSGVTHLQLYRERFHHLPADERAAFASQATGAMLSALCFDPIPAVIQKVLQNPHAGHEQARLIASHHQNTTGLEFLLARAELMRDTQVQRLLWRNPQLNEAQLRRLTQSKRLLELWKLSTSREVTSQTRANTAKLVRTRFSGAPAEERVELIFTSEGRALAGLSGLSVDGKTTALLCARTYGSTLLVQNLAHWGACPPALITHLLRQPLVMRQPRLKTMLGQHPNAPAGARESR